MNFCRARAEYSRIAESRVFVTGVVVVCVKVYIFDTICLTFL